MTSKDKFLTLIKNVNATAVQLLGTDVIFGLPTPSIASSKNTNISISAAAGSGYTGSVNVSYNRQSLTNISQQITLFSVTGFTPQSLIDKINVNYNKELELTDFQTITIPTLLEGTVERITLVAHPNSLFWIGNITISLLLGNNTQNSNEAVLFAIAELDNKFDHFFDVTPIVNKIGGFSGEVTLVQLNLDQVDNVPDLNKPISNLTQIALNNKLNATAMYLTRSNVSNDDLFLGNAVYAINDSTVDKANSKFSNKLSVIGIVSDDVILSQNGIGTIQTTGLLVGTIDQWFACTGMTGGLVPNKRYFLDSISGLITPYIPTEAIALCVIGKAVSTTELLINIETIINL